MEKNIDGGGVLGTTFGWIVAEQFRRLKDGDRFFFTQTGHEHSFTEDAIKALRSRRLSDVMCDNTKIQEVGSNAFQLKSKKIKCSDSKSKHHLDLTDINLLVPPEFRLGTAGKLCSDDSLQSIDDHMKCNNSFQEVKHAYPGAVNSVWHVNTFPKSPKGCFFHLPDKNLNWNPHNTGRKNPNDRPVCTEGKYSSDASNKNHVARSLLIVAILGFSFS